MPVVNSVHLSDRCPSGPQRIASASRPSKTAGHSARGPTAPGCRRSCRVSGSPDKRVSPPACGIRPRDGSSTRPSSIAAWVTQAPRVTARYPPRSQSIPAIARCRSVGPARRSASSSSRPRIGRRRSLAPRPASREQVDRSARLRGLNNRSPGPSRGAASPNRLCKPGVHVSAGAGILREIPPSYLKRRAASAQPVSFSEATSRIHLPSGAGQAAVHRFGEPAAFPLARFGSPPGLPRSTLRHRQNSPPAGARQPPKRRSWARAVGDSGAA